MPYRVGGLPGWSTAMSGWEDQHDRRRFRRFDLAIAGYYRDSRVGSGCRRSVKRGRKHHCQQKEFGGSFSAKNA